MSQIVEGHNILFPRKSRGAGGALFTKSKRKWGAQAPRPWSPQFCHLAFAHPVFQISEAKQPSKSQNSFNLHIFTYCRCCQNLRSCPPSFYKIALPLMAIVRKQVCKMCTFLPVHEKMGLKYISYIGGLILWL